jgi:outer membrane receptor for ferric coprogen and ferric-rhodotorulic acid
MKHSTSRSLASVAALLSAPFASLPAAETKPTTGDEVVNMEEVSVAGDKIGPATPSLTATKLPLSIRQTPQSITVISRERMDRESLFSVNDVLQNVTGVYTSFYDSQRPLYFARGFQITEFQVDGMPTYSGSTNQEYDTALYDRVEVIRGAHGLLTGAGIPSAVVNLTRKRPGKDFAASINATTGSTIAAKRMSPCR